MVLQFKLNLFDKTFTYVIFILRILQIEILIFFFCEFTLAAIRSETVN